MRLLNARLFLLFIVISHTLPAQTKVLNSTLFAQPVRLLKSIENSKTSNITEYYNMVPGKGFLYIRELQGKTYGVTLYDYDLQKVWLKESSIPQIKRMELLNVQSRENEFSLYFYKKRYLGFFPKSKLKEIVFSHYNGSISQYKYSIRNYTLPIGVLRVNNNSYLAGVECYKPWHLWRVIRFATPVALMVTPEMPVVTGVLAGLGTPSIFTWLFPTTPRTRPTLIKLEKGETTYINRKLYKTKYYRNKGIHALDYKDGNYYLGITNALKHGKNPIIIDRYDSSFHRISTINFPSQRKQRISAFRFDSLSASYMRFKGSYGDKIISSIGSIRYNSQNSNTQAFDGEVVPTKEGESEIKVENNENKLRDQDVNEVYRRKKEVIVNSNKIRKIINGQDIEITLFEDYIPDITEHTYTTYTNGIRSKHTNTILVGYFVRNLRLNIHNYTTNTYKVITSFQDFDLYEEVGRVVPTLMHSCLQFKDNKLFLHYVSSTNLLSSFVVHPDSYSILNLGSIQIVQEDQLDKAAYTVVSLDERKFLVAVDFYDKRNKEGKKNDRSERHKSIFNLYETQ